MYKFRGIAISLFYILEVFSMSYKCTECGYQSKDGEFPFNKVIEKRDKVYPNGSKGWEIAKIKTSLCKGCAYD